MKKRIIFLSQLFDPEYSIKGLSLIRFLREQGYDVEVVTTFPSYPKGECFDGYKPALIKKETVKGVPITRLWSFITPRKSKTARLLNYFSFFITSTFYLLSTRKADLLYAYHPQVTTGISATILKKLRKTKFITDIQDLWPESLIAEGLKEYSFLAKIVRRIVNFSIRNSSKVVVLSEGFRSYLLEKGVSEEKVEVIYNWCPEESSFLRQNERGYLLNLNKGPRSFFYTGNHGRLQALDSIIRAFASFSPCEATLTLIGEGSEKEHLKELSKKLGAENIEFMNFIPPNKLKRLVENADVMVCHLKDQELFKITIPSKIQAYLSSGKPLLIAAGGEANRLVLDAGAGFGAEPENVDSIKDAIKQAIAAPREDLISKGKSAQSYYHENLSADVAKKKIIEVIEASL